MERWCLYEELAGTKQAGGSASKHLLCWGSPGSVRPDQQMKPKTEFPFLRRRSAILCDPGLMGVSGNWVSHTSTSWTCIPVTVPPPPFAHTPPLTSKVWQRDSLFSPSLPFQQEPSKISEIPAISGAMFIWQREDLLGERGDANEKKKDRRGGGLLQKQFGRLRSRVNMCLEPWEGLRPVCSGPGTEQGSVRPQLPQPEKQLSPLICALQRSLLETRLWEGIKTSKLSI